MKHRFWFLQSTVLWAVYAFAILGVYCIASGLDPLFGYAILGYFGVVAVVVWWEEKAVA